MNLLARGNDKIGSKIFAYNLPARTTCPGMSAVYSACYATKGRWLFPAVRSGLEWNLRTARRRHFTEDMVEELRRRKVRLLRLHSSGDFFDATYTGRWAEILDRSPNVVAYAYTRSWRVGGIRPALEELADPPRMRLWYSADADTGMPSAVPARVRVAWLLQRADE